MNDDDVLNVIDNAPDWVDYGIEAIGDIADQGTLVAWMALQHDYLDELCAEVVPRAEAGELILEIFNPERDEKLYRTLREWFWRYVSHALDDELEKVWQSRNEAIKYDDF